MTTAKFPNTYCIQNYQQIYNRASAIGDLIKHNLLNRVPQYARHEYADALAQQTAELITGDNTTKGFARDLAIALARKDPELFARDLKEGYPLSGRSVMNTLNDSYKLQTA